jgi:cbb3-type cytochrome oxidase subunit 3
MIQNIYKSWGTSVVGIFFLSLGGGYLLLNPTPDYIVLSILLIGGVALLFFPDDIITQLKSFLSKKSTTL